LITIWPFPEKIVSKIGESAKKILVPEMNLGQLYHSVREAVGYNAEVIKLSKIGGALHSPQDIIEVLKEKIINV
jgi:2-oxoglutarate ferredoxin oxidoreductase subunit alpha